MLRALLLAALISTPVLAEVKIRKHGINLDDADVPLEIAVPAGSGPFPPVLCIHAKRGYEEVDTRFIRERAEQGFLVVAPDWLSGRMIERRPSEHNPETEDDVSAALDDLLALPEACKQSAGVVARSRGPYYAIRLAATRGQDLAATVSYYGHMQNPNAPSPTSCSASPPR